MIRIIEFTVSQIKNRDFRFDKKVSTSYVVGIALSKIACLIRGLAYANKIIFIGKGTKVLARKQLNLKSKNVELGKYCTLDNLSKEGITIGDNFKLGDFSKVIASGTIRDIGKGILIGNNVAIGEYSYIGGAGGVVIGNDCIIGQYFSLHPENHKYSNKEYLIREQGVSRKGIRIGNNCWIGAKVTICDGVCIGDNCVIAAGSVLTKSFGENSLIGGVPAKHIKQTYE
ncbi:acyltransferase [Shewanella submarina]|uniref:Acyltransferase n=2 Tax=Shewanella submarina TaxID=2016376 RepID=A0ABV7GFW6_9GAMM|nr:acyltransferase [Shewanella submarina]MCL1037492.1 acyltransferase [Shewanella submarina]